MESQRHISHGMMRIVFTRDFSDPNPYIAVTDIGSSTCTDHQLLDITAQRAAQSTLFSQHKTDN